MPNKGFNIEVYDSDSFTRAMTTSSTATSFTAPAATITKPSADGVHIMRSAGRVHRWIKVIPFGAGDADDVFEMWITGWDKTDSSLWIPTRLVKLVCTLSTFAGVGTEDVASTDLVCDTITAAAGISNVSYELFSLAEANTPAHALVRTNGCELIQFTFDATTGDPTSMNALFAKL